MRTQRKENHKHLLMEVEVREDEKLALIKENTSRHGGSRLLSKLLGR
jgi:hypothetical protein